MKKLVITNIVVLNGGDGAILFGMLKILRRAFGADCEIKVYASSPEVAKGMYPEVDFRETLGLVATRSAFSGVRYLGRILSWVRQYRYFLAAHFLGGPLQVFKYLVPRDHLRSMVDYRNADVVVTSGGTYLKEEYGMKSQTCDYQLTYVLERPLVFFTQTLGPFTAAATRRRISPIFAKAACILLRDERSKRNIEDLGVKTAPISLVADAAFALADPAVLEKAKRNSVSPRPAPRVAISVRTWDHFASMDSAEGMRRYREAVAEAVRQLVSAGAEVTFISTCQGIAAYDDDSVEAARIIALLDENVRRQVRLVRDFVRYDELLRILPEFDLCIGTRMHMCILSLLSGTPVLPIAYEFKTEELFGYLGLREWVTDIEKIHPMEFADKVRNFQALVPAIRESLFTKVLELHFSSLEAGDRLQEALGSRK